MGKQRQSFTHEARIQRLFGLDPRAEHVAHAELDLAQARAKVEAFERRIRTLDPQHRPVYAQQLRRLILKRRQAERAHEEAVLRQFLRT